MPAILAFAQAALERADPVTVIPAVQDTAIPSPLDLDLVHQAIARAQRAVGTPTIPTARRAVSMVVPNLTTVTAPGVGIVDTVVIVLVIEAVIALAAVLGQIHLLGDVRGGLTREMMRMKNIMIMIMMVRVGVMVILL